MWGGTPPNANADPILRAVSIRVEDPEESGAEHAGVRPSFSQPVADHRYVTADAAEWKDIVARLVAVDGGVLALAAGTGNARRIGRSCSLRSRRSPAPRSAVAKAIVGSRGSV